MGIPDSTYYSYSRIGQPGEDGVLVFLRRDVQELLFKRAKNPLFLRTFGLLLGTKIKRDDGFIVHIDGIYPLGRLKPGKESRSLTPKKWGTLQNRMYNYFPGKEIMGWYGIRNGWSAMLTEEDQRVHRDFFTKSWHILYLVDGSNGISSLFHWEEDILTRSRGCYLYWDKNHGAQRVFTDVNMSSTKGMPSTKEVPFPKRIPAIGAAGILILIITLGTFNGWWDSLFTSSFTGPKKDIQWDTDKTKSRDEERIEDLLKGLIEEEAETIDGQESGRPSSKEKEPLKYGSLDGHKGKGKSRETAREKELDGRDVYDDPEETGITEATNEYKDRIAKLEKELAERDRKIESLEKGQEGHDSDSGNSTLYTIQRGDNLYSISQKFYGTDRYGPALAKINRIKDQKSLMIGSYIVIPSKDEIEKMAK